MTSDDPVCPSKGCGSVITVVSMRNSNKINESANLILLAAFDNCHNCKHFKLFIHIFISKSIIVQYWLSPENLVHRQLLGRFNTIKYVA